MLSRRAANPLPKGKGLATVQKILVEALYHDAPLAALKAAVERESAMLTPDERQRLLAVDPDGFLLTALLVKKLRFERLAQKNPELKEAFRRDPEGFTQRFKRYNREVPPRFFFPDPEAQAFLEFTALNRPPR